MELKTAIEILRNRQRINDQMIGPDKNDPFSQFVQNETDAIETVLEALEVS